MFLSKFCTLPGWFFLLLFRRYVIILFGIGFLQKSDWRQKKFICKILNWIKMFTLQVLSERLVCSLNVYVVMIWYICKHLFDMLQIWVLHLIWDGSFHCRLVFCFPDFFILIRPGGETAGSCISHRHVFTARWSGSNWTLLQIIAVLFSRIYGERRWCSGCCCIQ